MNAPTDPLSAIRAINESAAFNRWCGIEVAKAGAGEAEIVMPWRGEVGQYAGFLHAGLIGALIDTACGFAAFPVAGPVAASHCAVRFLAPAAGTAFVATARVQKAGRRQVFVTAELHADGRLVAAGDTILVPIAAQT